MSEHKPGNPNLVSAAAELDAYISKAESLTPYSVEDFFKSPEEVAFTVSPDGSHIAYLKPVDSIRNICVRKIGSDHETIITHYKKRDIASYVWFNDTELGFIVDNDGDELFRLYKTDIKGIEPQCLTPYSGTTIQIVDSLIDDPQHMLIGLNKDDPRIFNLYRINTRSGELSLLEENNAKEPIQSWFTDLTGEVRAKIALRDGVNKVLYTKAKSQDEFKEILTLNFRQSLSPLCFHFDDPEKLWVRSNINRDKEVLTSIDINSGEEIGPTLFTHEQVDIGGLRYSRKEQRLLAVYYNADRPGVYFLDEEFQRINALLKKKLARLEKISIDNVFFSIKTHDKDERTFIVYSYSDINPGNYYLFDKTTEDLTPLCTLCPWLERQDMSPMQPISYLSRDGLTINGYLSLPKNHRGDAIPFVMNPHGGPWARNSWGFDNTVQMLTSLGYGVLQMNFRGSSGYGRDFWEKGFKQWGQAMQDDISDGVQWLIDQQLAQPQKIAIFGGSYGGYATLAGAAYTPKLYCCAVDFVGVSNLLTFLNTIPPYWQPLLEMMYEMVGDPEKDREMLEQYSPALNTDKIDIPLLVVQGAQDPRVNIDESDQIVENLRARGVDVLYMVKYDEGHGFAGESNRIQFYKLMVGFLLRYLGKIN